MPLIMTARLELRPHTVDDAPAILSAYSQDREVTRYLCWRPHKDLDEARAYLGLCVDGWEQGSEHSWAITLTGSQDLIGMVQCRLGGHKVELGYVLGRPYWGKGYMAEAVSAVMDRMLSLPDVYRVWAVCDTANAASVRVMEKAGMTCEGILKRWCIHPNLSPEPRDCFIYAKVR